LLLLLHHHPASRLNMTGAVMRYRANTLLSRSPRGLADGWMGL